MYRAPDNDSDSDEDVWPHVHPHKRPGRSFISTKAPWTVQHANARSRIQDKGVQEEGSLTEVPLAKEVLCRYG
jgi:hypothetical protein